jgi:hypothetical protein
MGIDSSPSPEALLRSLAISIVAGSAAYSLIVVTLAGLLSRRQLWAAWSAGVAVLTALAATYFVRSFPDQSLPVILYMIGAFLGIPSGLATWMAIRLEAGQVKRSRMRRLLTTFVVFVLAVPLGFVVGAIPDIAALF